MTFLNIFLIFPRKQGVFFPESSQTMFSGNGKSNIPYLRKKKQQSSVICKGNESTDMVNVLKIHTLKFVTKCICKQCRPVQTASEGAA